jgi:hypothetical protein
MDLRVWFLLSLFEGIQWVSTNFYILCKTKEKSENDGKNAFLTS